MAEALYSRIVEQWCAATGMQCWTAEDDPHIDLEGTTIGLFHSDACGQETLHVFADMGQPDFPGLHLRLLSLNVADLDPGTGYFGIHHDQRTVVFRLDIPLAESTDGAALPALIWARIQSARDRLRA